MKYVIKFEDQTYLTKHSAQQIANFQERFSQFDRSAAVTFDYRVIATLVKYLVGGSEVVTLETTERYQEGKAYRTIGGGTFIVTSENNNLVGYETVCGKVYDKDGNLLKENVHRYNRSTGGWCNGRTAGSIWTEDCLRYPPEPI